MSSTLTIGLPVYNGEESIARALDSLLSQSHQDFLLIISDNASTDGTEEICRDYASRDSRIRYVRQPENIGAALNFRFVLFAAFTPYFMWAAADDFWATSFVEKNLAFLTGNPDYVLSQSRVLFIKDNLPCNYSTGTYPLNGTVNENVATYFGNPADNSRYYGIFRTDALKAVYPDRDFHALDWAVSASTLQYGKHHELAETLMVRETTETVSYARQLERSHRRTILRVFPLLYMTLYMFRRGRIPYTLRSFYSIIKVNLYLHFLFGMYRWGALAERYLETNSLRSALGATVASSVAAIARPGIGARLRNTKEKIREKMISQARRLVVPAAAVWRRLPLSLETRIRTHKFVAKRFAPTISELGNFPSWQWRSSVPVFATVPGPDKAGMPDLLLKKSGWVFSAHLEETHSEVDIVLVSTGDIEAVLHVIDAVATAGDAAYHWVIVDNASVDVSTFVLGLLPNITLLKQTTRTSWGEAANHAVSSSCGSKLIFLGEGLVPSGPFVSEVTDALGATKRVIGGQVLSANGTLFSAGGFVSEAGQIFSAGRGQDAGDPRYASSYKIDFAPYFFAVERKFLNSLGGFRPEWSSLNTASARRNAKGRVQSVGSFYNPFAKVITISAQKIEQAESSNASQDPFVDPEQNGLKNLQRDDCIRLVAKKYEKRILFVDADTPTPDQNAGSIEVLNFMRILNELNFHVTFIPDGNFAYRGAYTDNLQKIGIEAIYSPYYQSVAQILQERPGFFDAVVLCRPHIAEKYLDLVRKHQPQAKIVFHTIDLHSLREMREAELANDAALIFAAKKTEEIEFEAIRKADTTIVLSSHELGILQTRIPDARVCVLPFIREVPEVITVPDYELREGIVFTGTYQHPPNRDAAIYMAREIWPLIRQQLPGVPLYLVGSALTPDVQALEGNGVEVLGFVQDLRALHDRCRLNVAPIRYGAGLKGKVSSALEVGLPTVSTSIGIEGTPLVSGESVLVADTPRDFADAVVSLYGNRALWEKISAKGFEFIRSEYSYEAGKKRISALFSDIGVETARTRAELATPAGSDLISIFQPSLFWQDLSDRNQKQLDNFGMENFKRTIANNYFQWLPGSFDDNQLQRLIDEWRVHPDTCPLEIVAESSKMEVDGIDSLHADNPFSNPEYRIFYAYFVGLLWDYVRHTDPYKVHEWIEEPALGKPIDLFYKGRRISQDLANSIDEAGRIRVLWDSRSILKAPRILELSAGYGRLAHVLLASFPCKYAIVDIPPAINVSRWYLSSIFPEKKIFGIRSFDSFEEVRDEIEDADICFFLPEQVDLLPDGFFDIGAVISALHEMRKDQIEFYKRALDRLVKHLVFMKNWTVWHNPADDIDLSSDDYQMGVEWVPVLDQVHRIHSDFTELAFVKPDY